MIINIAQFLVLGLIIEWAFRKLKMPGLLGMLILGFLFGPYALDLINPNLMAVSEELRLIALIIILLRAGFELSKDVLKSLGSRIILLAIVPAIIECFAIMILGPLLLDLSYFESVILGTILAAVSPAVVFPLMIRFKNKGMGVKKGIPDLILAMVSLDDVFVIFVYSILINSYIGGSNNILVELLGVPISILLGIFAGLIIGYFLFLIFRKFGIRSTKQVLILIGLSVILVQTEHILQPTISFTALLSIMAMAFMILQQDQEMSFAIAKKLEKIWVFAEIVLFTLVGSQVNFEVAIKTGLAGTAIILFGLFARSIGTYLCLLGSSLRTSEKIFVIISYLPKATVQAAIGAAPLAAMTAAGMETGPGEIILAIAFLSIIITAPLGAWAITTVGQKVLKIEPPSFKTLIK